MTTPLPDPRLRKGLEQVDTLKKQLCSERIRAGNLKAQLDKARIATDSKPAKPKLPTGLAS